MYEKKSYLVMIPHILFWKVQTQGDAEHVLRTQQTLISMCLGHLVRAEAVKTVPCSSSYFSNLLTYLNRVIVVKPVEFIQILQLTLSSQGLSLQQFVEEWIKKMDHLVSSEAARINVLAAYNMLPHLPLE